MKHPYIVNGEAWAMSLREMMGYPLYAPLFDTVAWGAGVSRHIGQAMQVTEIADTMGRDIVLLTFPCIEPDAPIAVSLAIRQDTGVEWVPNVTLYAATETAKIELLGGGRRWHIGSRFVMTGQKLPPKGRWAKGRWAKGEEVAMRRWRQSATSLQPRNVVGSIFVGPGKSFADAVPIDEFGIAD